MAGIDIDKQDAVIWSINDKGNNTLFTNDTVIINQSLKTTSTQVAKIPVSLKSALTQSHFANDFYSWFELFAFKK